MVVLVLALGAAPPTPAAAEESPLAAAARKEQERRAKLRGTDKVLTGDDLRSGGVTTPVAEAGAGESDASAEAKPKDGAAAAGDAKQKEARRDAIQREIDAQVERIRVVRKQVDDVDRELADQVSPSGDLRRAQIMQRREEGTQFIAETEARIAELQAEAQKLGVTVTRPE